MSSGGINQRIPLSLGEILFFEGWQFIGQGFEEGNQVYNLSLTEMPGFAVAIIGILRRKHITQGRGLTVMQIRSGSVNAQQGWCIVSGAHLFGRIIFTGSDIMADGLLTGQ